MVFEIGNVVPDFVGCGDKMVFDIDDSGCIMIVAFNNPNEKEIAQFSPEKAFEIRFVTLQDVIMIMIKVGELNWMDVPYTPHRSRNLTKLEYPSEGFGLLLTLILVDSKTGQIRALRALGLSTDFTRKLIKECDNIKGMPFSQLAHDTTIKNIYSKYTTRDLVKFSSTYCKFR